MNTPPDPFAQRFDAIAIDPTRAPSKAAIDSALSICAPKDDLVATAATPDGAQPGFYLLDDAGGRFIVDRDMGVISVRDETLLAREPNAVHPVRLKVVEPSGASYDLDLKLRLTGAVPQMIGAEDFGLAPEEGAAPAPKPAPPPPTPRVPWAAFAVVNGVQNKPALPVAGAYGALLRATLPSVAVSAAIALAEPMPAPSSARAAWSL